MKKAAYGWLKDAMKKFDPDEANAELAAMVKEETDKALANVLKESSNCMKNSFAITFVP